MKQYIIFFFCFLFLLANKSNAQGWVIAGNSNTNSSINFLGTKDNQGLVFKTSNQERMRIIAGGKIGIGVTSPVQKLDVNGNINIGGGFSLYMDNHRVLSIDSLKANTFLGKGVALNNTGVNNTASGFQALRSNTDGSYNTADGYQALYSNSLGYYNTANGYQALFSNNYGSGNTASGFQALYFNTTGSYNTANGYQAFYTNTTGSYNAVNGYQALYSNTTGRANVANGYYALYYNTSGSENTAAGAYALYSNTLGIFNMADGGSALFNNSTGSYNTASGYAALYNNTTGGNNVAVGYWARNQNYDSWNNTALGFEAGSSTHGWNNTFIGSSTDAASPDIYNSIALGNNVIVSAPNQVRIGNNFVNSIGGFANWTNISDGRVKKNIRENVPGLAFINKLKPITYNIDLDAADRIVQPPVKKDNNGKPAMLSQAILNARNAKQQIVYSGFVAQDVEKAAKELSYDFSGIDAAKNDKDLYGLRYSEFVVPLVKAVQELSKDNDDLRSALSDVVAQLKEVKKQLDGLKISMTAPVSQPHASDLASRNADAPNK